MPPTTCGATKREKYIVLSSNSHILDHTCRYMVPSKFSHQQDRIKMLPTYSHVWPHTVCYIQYHFWYHIHQFSTYFHVRGHNQFWDVLSICNLLWKNFQIIFINIYKDLNITLCVLYKVNHKGNKFQNITILPTKHRQYMARTESINKF